MTYQEKWAKIKEEKWKTVQNSYPKYSGVSLDSLSREEAIILVKALLERPPYGFSWEGEKQTLSQD